jgi:hypothetical protein
MLDMMLDFRALRRLIPVYVPLAPLTALLPLAPSTPAGPQLILLTLGRSRACMRSTWP